MPARKRPTPQDAATARRILLDGMARDTGVSGLAGELAPLHPRGNTFPGEVLLQVAADALEWCGASRADPLAMEGMPERFLPECAFRGRGDVHRWRVQQGLRRAGRTGGICPAAWWCSRALPALPVTVGRLMPEVPSWRLTLIRDPGTGSLALSRHDRTS
jgi:hypothetical protein